MLPAIANEININDIVGNIVTKDDFVTIQGKIEITRPKRRKALNSIVTSFVQRYSYQTSNIQDTSTSSF